MSRIAAKTSWMFAVASFAMLLAVQTLHSPLQHLHGCCDSGISATAGHSHNHSHAHRHSHNGRTHWHSHCHAAHSLATDTQSPLCDPCGTPHNHPDDCEVCQFLTQALQPLSMPVQLIAQEVISLPVVEAAPEAVPAPLTGPYVRGPPSLI